MKRCILSLLFFLKQLQSTFLYLLFASFIFGWWVLAFRSQAPPSFIPHKISQSLSLKTLDLLKELSLLQRNILKQALSGDFQLMIDLVDQWDKDALILSLKGCKGIQRLPRESYLQSQVLAHLIESKTIKSLHRLNCKVNLAKLSDDNGLPLQITDAFRRFFPQTHLSASFLLAIGKPEEIIALPKGLRRFTEIFEKNLLDQIPEDIDRISSERLYLNKPDVTFVAPYSHPPTLEAFRNQNIPLFSINDVNSIEQIREALLKVGHASNHILEAQLLALFLEACFLCIDNRLEAHHKDFDNNKLPLRILLLSLRQHYSAPTSKSLTGQLMKRALNHCPKFLGLIPESKEAWGIPFRHEQILQAAPDVLIVSTASRDVPFWIDEAFNQTPAAKKKRIYFLEETIQDSPTQYIALAYFDLYLALVDTHHL